MRSAVHHSARRRGGGSRWEVLPGAAAEAISAHNYGMGVIVMAKIP